VNKKTIFSVTKKDLQIDYFRCGGKGGQKVNKTSSGCRIKHPPSGAVGESREERYQAMNRKIAFKRLVNSSEFQNWAKLQAAMIEQGYRDVEEKVDKSMTHNKLKVEYVTTFTCDQCGASEAITSLDPKEKPRGWTEEACPRCQK
jgi:protein subunit release factor B